MTTVLKVYCINLARAPDRRSAMQPRLQKLAQDYAVVSGGAPLHFSFIDAVDGSLLDIAGGVEGYDREKRLRDYGWDLSPNEIACYKSHLKALDTAQQDGCHALVIEDDILFQPGLAAALHHIIHQQDIVNRFDVIRLNGLRQRTGAVLFDFPITDLGDSRLQIIRPFKPTCGAQAYLVPNHSLHLVIAAVTPIMRPYDNALDRFWQHNLRMGLMQPFMIADAEQGAQSTIRANHDPWREFRGLKKLRYRLKRQTRKWGDSLARIAYNLQQK